VVTARRTTLSFGLAAIAVLAGCVLAGTALWDTSVPTDLKLPHVGQDEFNATSVAEAERYESVARLLALAGQVVLIAVLAVYARRGHRLMRESAAGPIGTGFLLGMLGFCLVWLVGLPFSLAGFAWARHYDLVEIDYAEWLFGEFGTLTAIGLNVCLLLLIVMGFALLVRSAWWIPAAAVVVGISFGLAYVSGWLLTDTERPSSEVRADARELTTRERLPDVEVRVEPVREWTNAPNAYAVGLGASRRVVLWDTLVDDFPRDEVRSVLAHELGHHAHHHIARSVWWSALFLLPAGLITALVTRRRGGLGHPAAVPLALLVFAVLQLAATPLNSAFSRRLEAEADWAALAATDDPKAMERLFEGFTDEGLADPRPPGWWHLAFDSHPSGADRVAMARAWQERHGR
jgi:STE24 endopeptidase